MSGDSIEEYIEVTAEHTADRLTAGDSSRGTLDKCRSSLLVRQVLGDIMCRAPCTDYRHFPPTTEAGRSVFARMENGT